MIFAAHDQPDRDTELTATAPLSYEGRRNWWAGEERERWSVYWRKKFFGTGLAVFFARTVTTKFL